MLNFIDISEYFKQRDRVKKYTKLYALLEDSEMALVWPVCQSLDENFSLLFDRGFCGGYTVAWMDEIVKYNKLDFPLFSQEDWVKLKGYTSYHLDVMPLNKALKEKNKIYRKGSSEKRWAKHENFDELFHALIRQIPNKLPKNTHQVFRYCLFENYNEPNCISKRIFDAKLEFVSGHTFLICIDARRYVHFFDANLGWLRSKKSCQNVTDLELDILKLLKISDYHERYKILAIETQSVGYKADYNTEALFDEDIKVDSENKRLKC